MENFTLSFNVVSPLFIVMALGYYLKISVNSGENYYFNASERSFLSDIVNVMENCFNSTNPYITIDMKNSNIQYGDGNVFQSK